MANTAPFPDFYLKRKMYTPLVTIICRFEISARGVFYTPLASVCRAGMRRASMLTVILSDLEDRQLANELLSYN
jgi:hypothetical protein